MNQDHGALAKIIAKDEIRDLAMLYSRGVDRKDAALLRTLYTPDATEWRGRVFQGTAAGFIDFLEGAFLGMPYSGHHICNHLIAVDGDRAEGEVYAVAFHIVADGKGGWLEVIGNPRYFDRYVRQAGRWLFASRTVSHDMRITRPAPAPPLPMHLGDPAGDMSYAALSDRLFARATQGDPISDQ